MWYIQWSFLAKWFSRQIWWLGVSILEPLDSLLAPREGPYRFVVDLWCFLSMLDGSGAPFWGLWARFWHLGRVPGITLGHPGAQTPKNIKNKIWGDPLNYFLSNNLTLLRYVFEVRLPKASGSLFQRWWNHFSINFEGISQPFCRCWKPWKM